MRVIKAVEHCDAFAPKLQKGEGGGEVGLCELLDSRGMYFDIGIRLSSIALGFSERALDEILVQHWLDRGEICHCEVWKALDDAMLLMMSSML